MLKKAAITPALPQARQDAPFPGFVLPAFGCLTYRTGKERVSARLGGRVKKYVSPSQLAAALLDTLFEHSSTIS
jgi:hypothetical protein